MQISKDATAMRFLVAGVLTVVAWQSSAGQTEAFSELELVAILAHHGSKERPYAKHTATEDFLDVATRRGGLIGTQAFAQTAPPAPVIDLTGEWAARVHEDAIYRGAGGFLGDYEGLPINAAARQMAESWDADVLSQPERNTQAHPAVYAMRGEGPNIRISEIRDPATEQLIGLRIVGMFGRADRTVWLDGRPHPSEYAEHTWDGFSTGTFHDGELTVTTTHMKMGVLQKVGVYASPYSVMTEHYYRHGLYLTMVTIVDDPIYLEEPFVRSQTWVLDTKSERGPRLAVGIS